MITPFKLLINGEWTEAENFEYFDDINPATGKKVAKVARATSSDCSKAIKAAHQSLPAWQKFNPDKKKSILENAAKRLTLKKTDLARTLTLETGMNPVQAAGEISQAVELIEKKVSARSKKSPPSSGIHLIFIHWHSSVYNTVKIIVDSILNGFSMVINPSMETPITCLLIARMFLKAGLEKNMINVVTGPMEFLCPEFFSDNRIGCITMPNKTKAFAEVISNPADEKTKRNEYYSFGQASFLILEDKAVNEAVSKAVQYLVHRLGDAWVDSGHVFVSQKDEKQVVTSLIESLKKLERREELPGISWGATPLINEQQVQKIHAQVNEAIIKGGRVCIGGCYEGCFYKPTVIAGVTEDMKVFTEQEAGPVIPVVGMTSEIDAVEGLLKINRPKKIYLFSTDQKRICRILDAISSTGEQFLMTRNESHLVLDMPDFDAAGIPEQFRSVI